MKKGHQLHNTVAQSNKATRGLLSTEKGGPAAGSGERRKWRRRGGGARGKKGGRFPRTRKDGEARDKRQKEAGRVAIAEKSGATS